MYHALRRFVSILITLCVLLAGMAVQETRAATGPRCYVDSTPSGVGNTGDSWADAYVNLLAALYDANCTEVWVAAGVYKPGALRTLAFIVDSGETVYGGFAGTETSLSERAPGANITVLSGDIDNNDVVDADGITLEAADIVGENSYHVVLISPASEDMTPATILDGFTITAGNADPNVTSIRDGGGVLCHHIYECNPTLRNLRIFGNAANRGGGLYNAGWQTGFASSPTLINVTFSGNYASFNGGGMYNDGNNGGLSSPTLVNVTFNNNHADSYGGAMYNDGGNDFPGVIYGTSAPDLTNVTISGNSATLGGAGIYNWQETGFPGTNLTNVILWGNTAPSDPEMNNSGVDPNVDHSIIQGSMPGGVWNPAFGTDGGGNQDADPALGPLSDNGGFTETMALGPRSPAIDRGDNGVCPAQDQRTRSRPWAYTCDVGAYEFYPCFVDDSAGGLDDGSSWTNAYNDLQTALGNTACTAVWVAEGIYKPGASESDYFSPDPGIRLFGGFAGTEELISERVPGAYSSVLSGDIDNNDTHTNGVVLDHTGISGDNSDHVLFLDGTSTAIDPGTIIDGFTITAGQADGNAFPHFSGAGLYCQGFEGQCSPLLRNLDFSGNISDGLDNGNGGALYNNGGSGESSPRLEGITFRGNYADGNGGAIYNSGVAGISSPTITNATFFDNASQFAGGAMYNSGISLGAASPQLTNVTFNANSANFGGAMYNNAGTGMSAPMLTNVILWGDSATNTADEIFNTDDASTALTYSVVEGGEASISDGDEDPFTGNPGNLSTSPELGTLRNLGGYTPVIPFAPAGSSALDIALGGASCPQTDQRGRTRPQGPGCDRGAYERPNLPPPADFDGDADTEVSVFRDGTWFVMNQGPTGWGQIGDIPIAADYDGDTDSDFAVYRPSTGGWRVKDQFVVAYGGIAGDVPVPGDYDYDGDTDVAIYRSSTAGWYIKDQFLVGYGLPTDVPVPGDYDGDGDTDVAVFRDGTWFIKDQGIIGYGQVGDIPIPGDYDGDGITDIAVYRPSTGGWRVKDQFVVAHGGLPGDLPVPGDYNRDGRTDVAIYRSSTAGWYIKDQFTVGYGLSTDYPVPARDTNGDGDPYQ